MDVHDAANGVWVTRLLAVALEPFEAHGVLKPAVGFCRCGGRDWRPHQKRFRSLSRGCAELLRQIQVLLFEEGSNGPGCAACRSEHLLGGVLVLYDNLTDKAVDCRKAPFG